MLFHVIFTCIFLLPLLIHNHAIYEKDLFSVNGVQVCMTAGICTHVI